MREELLMRSKSLHHFVEEEVHMKFLPPSAGEG
jgi:hypothetical protein